MAKNILILTLLVLMSVFVTVTMAQTEEQYHTEKAKIKDATINEFIHVGDTILGKMTVIFPSYCFKLDVIKMDVKGNIVSLEVIARAPLEMACPDREKISDYDIVVAGLAEGAYTVRIANGQGGYIEKGLKVIRSAEQSILKLQRTIGTSVETWLVFEDGVVYYTDNENPMKFQRVKDIKKLKDFIGVTDNKEFFTVLGTEDLAATEQEGSAIAVFTIIYTSQQFGSKTFKYSFDEKKSAKYIKKKLHLSLQALMDVIS